MANNSGIKTLVVPRSEKESSLQDFLATRLNLSKRAAKNLLDNKKVWVNRHSVWMAHHALHPGDTIEIVTSEAEKHETEKNEKPHIRVLWEDEDYLIIDKPTGLLTVGKGSVEEIMRAETGKPMLKAVHRLDREASGCLLLAKTYANWEAAVPIFKTRQVHKTYVAISTGIFDRPSQTIDQELDGERAVSHIHREAISNSASFLRVEIETGRTHQIRRHLAMIRLPIIGDRLYGMKTVRDPRLQIVPRLMLHASELSLPHPTKQGEMIKAHSPLPADFRRCLQIFGMGQ